MTADAPVEYVVRFSPWARFQHAAIIVLFGLLLVTGMPQKWPAASASVWVVDAMGGIFAARWLHRVIGIVFSVLVVAHLAVAITGLLSGRMKGTMLLGQKDFRDAINNLRYYAGYTDTAPQFGRFDYRQKFEYWGLIFGSLVMVATGFILYFPIAVAGVLPAELIPAAKVMHSYEALFAFLIVLVWHIAGAFLSPEAFPVDASIFTGKIRKDKLRHEHRLEYDELFKDQ
ncbi:MAG: cytochrome b/b6 domain-containing protein [Acidobacteriota bacterium]|nr:cytochrome b/b6 domain-containing protein [Acidobacteriota bacterium]MDP2391215.1 cytochrome b/b6 domain-containing protein [Acidobacteriota bacterium]